MSANKPVDVYTHGHHESVMRSHMWRTVENSAGYLIPSLVAGATLLDVGCGPGTITIDMAARVAPGTVIGIDAGADVIEKATAAGAASGLDNVSFAVGNCYSLDFPDDSFDIVHAHQVLQHLTDPVAALKEMRRVVKPGGVVAVRDADYHGMFWAPQLPVLDRWMEIYQGVARANDAEPDAGRFLLGWAQEVGFESITPSADTWCFATPEDRDWWGNLWADRVQASALGEQALSYGIATKDELASVSAAWHEWMADPAAWFAVVNAELLCRQ